MQCRYCQAWNEGDERRCVVCGRRLHVSARPASEPLPFSTSTAPALETFSRPEPAPSAPPRALNFQQPSLFRDPNGPKVIPIPTMTPMRPNESESPQKRPSQSSSRSRRTSDSQQSLDFHSTPKSIGTQVEAVIYCDAPVALPAHRAIAAAVDLVLILLALAVFLAIFFVSGGVIAFSRQNIPFFIGVAVVMALF